MAEELPESVSIEEAWSKEITRRIEEIDSGEVKPVSWKAARCQIADLLKGS